MELSYNMVTILQLDSRDKQMQSISLETGYFCMELLDTEFP